MTTDVWDPERLATAGWIMNRYAEHLRPNDRIRFGQEGDPCSTYSSSEEAPSARVQSVEREADGTVRFRAVVESSGETVVMGNRSVAPNEIWELHPQDVEAFRERMQRREDAAAAPAPSAAEMLLEDRVRDMEYRGTEMERTVGGAIRELAGDMMRVFRGEAPEFSLKFADQYDHLTLTTPLSGRRDTAADEEHHHQSPDEGDRHAFSDDEEHHHFPDNGDRHSRDGDDRHAFSDEEHHHSRGGDDRHAFSDEGGGDGDDFRAADSRRGSETRSRAAANLRHTRDGDSEDFVTPLAGFSGDVRAVVAPDDP